MIGSSGRFFTFLLTPARLAWIVSAAAGCIFTLAHAQGHSSDVLESIAERSSLAEMVFYGEVTDISYSNSIEGMPHTFVSFTVDEVLLGEYSDPIITLRFVGGEDTDPARAGETLHVSHMPEFTIGARQILLVANNGMSVCPLVACEEGALTFNKGLLAHVMVEKATAKTPTSYRFGGSVDALDKSMPENVPDVSLKEVKSAIASAAGSWSKRHSVTPAVSSADYNVAFDGPDLRPVGPPNIQKGL